MTRALPLALLAVLLLAAPAGAYFERVDVDARGLALAGSFGAAVEDVSAAHWNPAALSVLAQPQGLFTYSRPYMVEDLTSGSVVAGLPFAGGGTALSWHRLALDGVVSEDLIGLSYGRWVYRDNNRAVHLGATGKLAAVSFDSHAGGPDRDFGSKTKFTGDLGLLWQERTNWRFGAVLRNLGEPEFNFIGDSGGDKVPGGVELSASYRWRPESTIMCSRSDLGDHPTWNYAGEIWFYDVFAVRAGIYDEEFAGGIGVKGTRWEVDTAFLTHAMLGNTYRASLRLSLPERGARR